MRARRCVAVFACALALSGSLAHAQPGSSEDAFSQGAALGRNLAEKTGANNVQPVQSAPGTQSDAGAALANSIKARTLQPVPQAQAFSGQMLKKTTQGLEQNQKALEQAIADSGVQSGKAFLTDTDNGMPILPPGMTVQQASQYISHDWPERREKTAKVFILISLGMPQAVLKNLFAQVAASQVLRDETVFMLQGWADMPGGFQNTIMQAQELEPSGSYRSPVLIDPVWFESLHVTRVPAIVVANTDHNGMIMGDGLSVLDARDKIAQGKSIGQTFGRTWPITEMDALKTLQNAAKKVDLAKAQAQAQKTMWAQIAKQAPALPEVERSVSSTFDPSIMSARDIALPDGRVLVRKGQRINPLDTPLAWNTLRFIVFDAQKPWQVKQAQAWAKTYPNAHILMAEPPSTESGWLDIEHAFGGTPVKIIEPFVAQRLGVSAAPAMVWPDHDVLRIFVQGRPAKKQ